MDHVYSNKAEPSVELNPTELPGAARDEQAGGHKGEGWGVFFFFFSVGIIMCVLMMEGDGEEGETVKLSRYQNKGV